MKRISAILITFVLMFGIFTMAAGANPPAMDVISFDDGKTDGEMIVFQQGGALVTEFYDGCLSTVLPDIYTGFVTTEAYEDFTIQFDVGGVSSSSCLAGISFGLESTDTVAMTDGHMMQIGMDTLQLINYNNPDAPANYIVAESVRGTCVGMDRYWPLSQDEWMVDTFTDKGDFQFGYKRNTYKLVKEGSTVRVYRKNNIISENAQDLLFELVNVGWTDVKEDAGYVRISFINSDEYWIDNVCFSPEPYADFPVKRAEPEGTEPTVPPTEAPTQAPTVAPTEAPTVAPTEAPTQAPTAAPTEAPTQAPTAAPTEAPTQAPTVAPTEVPTVAPTTPSATEPAATEPVATEPVATEPIATEPIATEPPATEPPATEPAATEPAIQDNGNATAEKDDTLTWVLIGGGAAVLVVIAAILVALRVKKRRN